MDINTLNNYIEDRLQNNYSVLLDNISYIELNKLYNSEYKHLSTLISNKDLKVVETLIDIKSRLLSEEVYLSYKIGFSDGFDLSNHIKF